MNCDSFWYGYLLSICQIPYIRSVESETQKHRLLFLFIWKYLFVEKYHIILVVRMEHTEGNLGFLDIHWIQSVSSCF